MNKPKTASYIEYNEGFRRFVCNDATGVPVKSPEGKLTVGIGLNLEDRGLTILEARYIMNNIIDEINSELPRRLIIYNKLDDVRQAALIDMAYCMGLDRLIDFNKTFNYLRAKDFKNASVEIMRSLWAEKQTGRASRDSYMIETGEWPVGIGLTS